MSRYRKISTSVVGYLLLWAHLAVAGGPAEQLLAPTLSRHAGATDTQDAKRAASPAPPYAEGDLLVQFSKGTAHRAAASVHARLGATVVKEFTVVEGLQLVRLPLGLPVQEALARYREHPDVVDAEPNFRVQILQNSRDPFFDQLWGLRNTGQAGGTPEADIDADAAWEISRGNRGVVVAVIDTGIDYAHTDLAANMWRNTADCNSNGVDDDGNGYIDDCYGIDAVNADADPMDDNNHGTHVAGTIGAVGNNAIGVVGVAWRVRLMACKFLDSFGFGYIDGAITCLQYVRTMKERGVNIVATNNSWGGGEFSRALRNAIAAQRQHGILFIAAAGNATLDNDAYPNYPSNYFLSNVIAVAATDRFDDLAYFSNYGRHTVHLAAPGHEILSSIPGNAYDTYSGTSMATPHVTGVAALLKAQDPSRDWRAIKNLLLAGGDTIPAADQTITGKRLNAQGALTCTNAPVRSRLRPIGTTISAGVGTGMDLAMLHINCDAPRGNVTVTVAPGGQRVRLQDNGLGVDQTAGDGIYAGRWTPTVIGTYTLTFPGGDVVTVHALTSYNYSSTPFIWRTITGTHLQLSDDASARIRSPFPIRFGDGRFRNLFVNSNGNVSFTDSFPEYANEPMPTSAIPTLVAPFWDDLYPIPETNRNIFWAVRNHAPHRELVIEWRRVRHFACSGDRAAAITFQVVFFEGRSDVLFNYADVDFGGDCAFADRGGDATVGIQVASEVGTQFSWYTPRLENHTALLWTVSSEEAQGLQAEKDIERHVLTTAAQEW